MIGQVYVDKEYVIMSEIEDNDTLTQRDLSHKLGVSVSTINVLINKMAKDGLIKISQVSKRQVLYMLTPNGIIEKTKKTAKYLKVHYKVIYETQVKIKSLLVELTQKHDVIFILMYEDEMGEIINDAVHEYMKFKNNSKIKIIKTITNIDIDEYNCPLLLHVDDDAIEKTPDDFTLDKLNLITLL